MKEWTAFLIWALCGAAMIGIGGYAHISKKTMGFFKFNFISVYFIESPQRTQRTQRVI